MVRFGLKKGFLVFPQSNVYIIFFVFMSDLVVRGGSLGFSRRGLIFIPVLVVQGSSLAFSRGGHFELSSALLSLFAQVQMLVTELGPDHGYSIRFGPGP